MDQRTSGPRIRSRTLIGGLALLLVLIAASAIYLSVPHRPPLPCDASTLQIRETKLIIQTLAHKPGDPLRLPTGKPNVAFWIEGTNAHFVFGLSPTGRNVLLAEQFAVGDPIQINWGDCSSDEYVVSSIDQEVPQDAALLDQSQGGITVFVPKSSGSAGWRIEGERPEALTPQSPEATDANAVQAEVSFLEQSVSADGKTLLLKVEIKNTGTKPIHLAQGDISLTGGDGVSASPQAVEPSLPLDVQPGLSEIITISFAKPSGNVANFKLLDFSVDLYF